MKATIKPKCKKSKERIPFDPILFAATVPSRKPTAKDVEDTKKHANDPIEPREYDSMEEMVEDL